MARTTTGTGNPLIGSALDRAIAYPYRVSVRSYGGSKTHNSFTFTNETDARARYLQYVTAQVLVNGYDDIRLEELAIEDNESVGRYATIARAQKRV